MIGRPYDSGERICADTRVRRVSSAYGGFIRRYPYMNKRIWVTASDREILLLLLLTTAFYSKL